MIDSDLEKQGEKSVLTFLMSSMLNISGESPPWTQRNCWFMMAASGRQSNESMHVSYTVSEYLILPAARCSTICTRTLIQCYIVLPIQSRGCGYSVPLHIEDCIDVLTYC